VPKTLIEKFFSFEEGRSYRCRIHDDNRHRYVDEIVNVNNSMAWYLHGNLIAHLYLANQDLILWIHHAGWKTQLTHDRLNGILWYVNKVYGVDMRIGMRIGLWEHFLYIAYENNGDVEYIKFDRPITINLSKRIVDFNENKKIIPHFITLRLGSQKISRFSDYTVYRFWLKVRNMDEYNLLYLLINSKGVFYRFKNGVYASKTFVELKKEDLEKLKKEYEFDDELKQLMLLAETLLA